jgi:predicted nucleotidyltransferase
MSTPNFSYLTIHGSRAYGLNRPDSDYDIRGFFIPKVKDILGYRGGPENFQAKESFSYNGTDYQDADVMAWDIRKFFRLASEANPNVLETLYTDNDDHIFGDRFAAQVLGHKNKFLSRKVARSFGGYAISQLRKVKVDYWDIEPTRKDAMHLLRLIDFGQQLLRDGNLKVKYGNPDFLLGVRAGLYKKEEVIATAELQLEIMNDLEKKTSLPKEPDHDYLEHLLFEILRAHVNS